MVEENVPDDITQFFSSIFPFFSYIFVQNGFIWTYMVLNLKSSGLGNIYLKSEIANLKTDHYYAETEFWKYETNLIGLDYLFIHIKMMIN